MQYNISLYSALFGLGLANAVADPPANRASTDCLNLSLTNLVCRILPNVYVAPIMLCGLGALNKPVQEVLDGLGLGVSIQPPTACVAPTLSPVLYMPV